MTKVKIKPTKKEKALLDYLGKAYSLRIIDGGPVVYRDLGNGCDIEISGVNHPSNGDYCDYVCVWDVRLGKDVYAHSLEYVWHIKSPAHLERVLDELVWRYCSKTA